MKIMMLVCADSIHAVKWANAYVNLGHIVHFVSMPDHREKVDSFLPEVKVHYLKYKSPEGYILNVHDLKKMWKELQPDVMNVHYATGYGMLARLAGIHPMVLSVWGSDVYDFPNKNRICKNIVVKNIQKADKVASTSYVMANQVRNLIGEPEKEIVITPFGVDINKFCPGNRAEESSRFIVGLVKKLTYKYGIDFVIKSFALFYERWIKEGKKGKEPHLFICGKGENRKDFETLRDSLGLHSQIEIQGYIPNDKIPDYLRTFDVFCLGSQLESESFGVAAVEAMACGICVVATGVDGFKEVIEDNRTGFIVDKSDEEQMAEKLWELYCKPDLRKKMGEHGRERVQALYDWNNNVKTMESLLIEVCEEYKNSGKNG